MLSCRSLFVAILCVSLIACSRDYDVTIPPQVAPDAIDCEFGEVYTPLINSLEVFGDTNEGTWVTLGYWDNLTDLSATQSAAITSGTFNFYLDVIDFNTQVDLESLLQAKVSDIRIEANIVGVADTLPISDETPFAVDVRSGSDRVTINAEITIEATETREACYFLATRDESGLADDDSTEDESVVYSRKFTEEYVLDFELDRKLDSDAQELMRHTSVDGGDFGSAVAMSEIYLAVGEPGNDHEYTDLNGYTLNNLVDSGAVHIYERITSPDWTLCAILKPSNARANDGFGSSVAWSDGSLIVGSPFEDRSGSGVYNGRASTQALAYDKPDSGAIYVFEENTSELCDFQEVAYIKSPDNPTSMTYTDALFGHSLASYRDQVVIGAPNQQQQDISLIDSRVGKAYLYKKNIAGDFNLSTQFSSPIKHANEQFGFSVGIGERFVVIGAPGDGVDDANVATNDEGVVDSSDLASGTLTNVAAESGAAHVFIRDHADASLLSLAYLKPDNSDDNDRFGTAAAVSGRSIFVGAPNEDSSSKQTNAGMSDNSVSNNGAVYRYLYNELDNLVLKDYLKPTQTQEDMYFGSKVDASTEFLASSTPGLLQNTPQGSVLGGVEIIDIEGAHPNFSLYNNDAQSGTAIERSGVGLDFYGPNFVLGAPGFKDAADRTVGSVIVLD